MVGKQDKTEDYIWMKMLASGIGRPLFVVLLFGAIWTYMLQSREPVVASHIGMDRIPQKIGDWVGHDQEMPEDTISEQLAPQAILMRRYVNSRDDSKIVELCLVYNFQRRSVSFHDPNICYPAQGWSIVNRYHVPMVLPESGKFDANVSLVQRGYENDAVTYFYLSGARPVEGGTANASMWESLRARLLGGVGVTCMVRLSSAASYASDNQKLDDQREFLKEAYPYILAVNPKITQRSRPLVGLCQNYGTAGAASGVLIMLAPLCACVMVMRRRS